MYLAASHIIGLEKRISLVIHVSWKFITIFAIPDLSFSLIHLLACEHSICECVLLMPLFFLFSIVNLQISFL
jgi:hypothetical protein